MMGFFVVNLLIPDEPSGFDINTPSGPWTLGQFVNYANSKAAIEKGQCAMTYFLENDVPVVPAAASEAAFEELTPILLGASYATGLTVTIKESTMGSEIKIVRPTDHWPRDRAMGIGSPVVSSADEFRDIIERFVRGWPGAGQTEKARLLIHHWLDALACWSLEDLYLSATTLSNIYIQFLDTA